MMRTRCGRPCARVAGVFAAVGCLAMPPSRAIGDIVVRRGSEAQLEGKIKRVDSVGVLVVTPSGAENLVTWDRVRDVQMQYPDKQIEAWRDTANNLWRARSRLERGDAALAEPLFERLFAEYRSQSHETALIVAEGLLRCRLARGANDGAVIPALEMIRMRRKGVTTIAYSMLAPVFDDATDLCPRLPPAWPNTAAVARLDEELKSYDAGGDPTVAAMAGLYRAASRQIVGMPAEQRAKIATEQAGVALMQLMVDAGASDAPVRENARIALEKKLPDLPTWAQAWARFAIGASLLRESGVGRQQSGVVNLAWLPASFEREQPYLGALALGEMAAALEDMGDVEGAVTLRTELQRQYPNLPGLNTPRRRATANPPAASMPAAPQGPATQAAPR